MTDHSSPFTPEQIGSHTVRFSSTGIFETHKDQMVDPYAATKIPKEAQVEGTHYAPQTKDIFPSIVLLHDRWGLTSQIKNTALKLACEGYVVLVPNLYGRQGGMITANSEVADALMERMNEQHALQDINACCEYLNANLSEDTTLEQTKTECPCRCGIWYGRDIGYSICWPTKTTAHRGRLLWKSFGGGRHREKAVLSGPLSRRRLEWGRSPGDDRSVSILRETRGQTGGSSAIP